MTTDFRALCAELIASWDADGCDWKPQHQARWEATVARARAALAALADGPAVPEGREPVSVVEEPCDEELLKLARAELNNSPNWEEPEYDASNPFPYEAPGIAWLNFARAVLARFGHHSPEATKMVSDAYQMGRRDASADCQQAAEAAEDEVAELALKELERTVVLLMPVTGHKKIKRFDTIRAALKRLQELENNADLSPAPAPADGEVVEPTVPTVMEIVKLSSKIEAAELGQVDFARAVLARWGNPAPQPPAKGEVAELAEFLRACAGDHYGLGHHQFTRAAELLQRLSPPQPVPVSERLPGPEDCDAEGGCWWLVTGCNAWSFGKYLASVVTHWLPAHALPISQQQQENHQ